MISTRCNVYCVPNYTIHYDAQGVRIVGGRFINSLEWINRNALLSRAVRPGVIRRYLIGV